MSASGSMNWEPVRRRLLSTNLSEALKAASELRLNIEIVHTTEFPLLLSALLPAFSSVLAHRTRPSPDTSSVEHKLRHAILDIISKMPTNEVLRPHAPHLVVVAMDILNRDYEDNSLLASKIVFDLYKVYRSLPQDYVQPYLDFVVNSYRTLPQAIQRNFAFLTSLPVSAQAAQSATVTAATSLAGSASGTGTTLQQQKPQTQQQASARDEKQETIQEGEAKEVAAAKQSSTSSTSPREATPVTSSASPSPSSSLALRSNMSFRVLTESPLIVMLMLQLYPSFLKTNIPILISVMMDSLTPRAPPVTSAQHKLDSSMKRLYYSRSRELVAAQAKTLSFVAYLLRSFSTELKPYEDRMGSSVLALMNVCPRESISTRKELLVATRHILNSDFRKGLFRHIDSLLDERVLMGTHHRFSDQALLRPLGYMTLSDLVQHARSIFSMKQMSKVVLTFSRVLHDSLPMTTQYTAVRTLLSVVDIIFQNKDPNPQIGRDLLVRMLQTLVDKLASLVDHFPTVLEDEKQRAAVEGYGTATKKNDVGSTASVPSSLASLVTSTPTGAPPDSVRDIHVLIRAIIVGNKTIISHINGYRSQREKLNRGGDQQKPPPPGPNEEVSTAMCRLTNTEAAIIDRYILTVFPAAKLLKEKGASYPHPGGGRVPVEKSLAEQHRDALTYFAGTFTGLDGVSLARTLGKRLDVLIDAIIDDPLVMVVPRHLLGANPTISLEFSTLLLDHLVERMDELSFCRSRSILFLDPPCDRDASRKTAIKSKLERYLQLPAESEERQKKKSTTLLQLFERVMKSLSAFAENESIVRRHLRRIVAVCLRSSLEETESWPDNYCTLLRCIFRSISAGKFEDSYRELFPLIPTVLNGLYRVISCSKDIVLRYIAVELCLTIPARLSSLLPHMNLLLRVIIPALDSNSGDLVNLGLRTLEFWVDNLNPRFLIPEISKQTDLFTILMQALSCHLRPAPYPYGLLTLRLLGKLGGINRRFLREPLFLSDSKGDVQDEVVFISCHLDAEKGAALALGNIINIPLPLDRCVEVLRLIATNKNSRYHGTEADVVTEVEPKVLITWDERSRLWTERIDRIDVSEYQRNVMEQTKASQAKACATVLKAAARHNSQLGSEGTECTQICRVKAVLLGLMYASVVDATKSDSLDVLKKIVSYECGAALRESMADFLRVSDPGVLVVGLEVLRMLTHVQDVEKTKRDSFIGELLSDLCKACSSSDWGDRAALQSAICFLIENMGAEWSRKHEVELITTTFVAVKSVPLELSNASAVALHFFFRVCTGMYGTPWVRNGSERSIIWDVLEANKEDLSSESRRKHGSAGIFIACPSDDVFRIVLVEIAASQDIVRFAARFLMINFIFGGSTIENSTSFVSEQTQISLVRKVLFSRSLRLLPLSQQVGVVEGLAVLVHQLPGILSLSDQHLLAFVSELLKMSSVADGEMADSDSALKDVFVDKNGYSAASESTPSVPSLSHPTHSSSLFRRRVCVVDLDGASVIVPEQLPSGVQLRVSAIVLLHSIIRAYSDPFFDADKGAPIGHIRPHVISLLFRSLVSTPLKAVSAAHAALRDALTLSMGNSNENSAGGTRSHNENSAGGTRPHTRLPKELLQACIRPVLLNLRDYTRLSIPLLRGLKRLLALLSSWFNRTLGEKLLDHLQKWLDPNKIISLKIWKEGEEPYVAAAIVDIFPLLPNATQFVDPLVKTCMKLEACLSAYSVRLPESPYRQPLARYLDRHPQYAVGFFFQRLKSPVYSELFQSLIRSEDSSSLRSYLSGKQCSVMVLNYCFERPLAIIRSEKNSSTGSSSAGSLFVHGVGSRTAGVSNDAGNDPSAPKPMTEESLELQLQGFRLVEALLANNPGYFDDHNDIVRAFRWLWRSKGRFLRFQHEDSVSPRFHCESRMLATFLMIYGKSLPNDDFDILFELIRVFLQPSSADFGFVSRFLRDMVSRVLTIAQKQQVMNRFFTLISGESSEETKVLSMQLLIYPMVSSHLSQQVEGGSKSDVNESGASNCAALIDESLVERYVKEVLFPVDSVVSCGDRLKVELLKLCHVMVSYAPRSIESRRNEIVKFCWGLLKSEDTSCKGWAYLVVCRCISAFDTPEKIVLQVFTSLLRLHQQEGRELVREALDVLIPALPKRLNDEEFRTRVDQATKLMLEDSNSTPQLAHISQLIVRNPKVFFPYRNRFSGYMLNSLNRLGLPPNSPIENRVLAVSIVELLLDWDSQLTSDESKLFSSSQIESVANFLIRLKILLAEPSDPRNPRLETSAVGLDCRVVGVFNRVMTSWNCVLKEQPFEKVVTKDREMPALLLSCLEILVVLTKLGRLDFFTRNSLVVNELVSLCFKHAKDDQRLQGELRTLVVEAGGTHPMSTPFIVSLEKAIVDANGEMKRSWSQRTSESTSRQGRNRASATEAATVWALFCLDLLCELCMQQKQVLTAVASSLLSLASTLVKNHLLEANSKQRHGASLPPRVTASGVKCHTPTVGIMECCCLYDPAEASRPPNLRQRWLREEPELTPSLRSLLKILSTFESSDIAFQFTQNRKVFFQILGSIVDSSDSLSLLLGALRTVCKLLLFDDSRSPLTNKEKTAFLLKLAAFDSTNLIDDVATQPLADLVSLFAERFQGTGPDPSDIQRTTGDKVFVSCLLNANVSSRECLVGRFLRSLDSSESGDTLCFVTHLFQTDFEALGGRFWIALLVEAFLCSLSGSDLECLEALQRLAHGDVVTCLRLFELLLPAFWDSLLRDESRLQLIGALESLLSRQYHSQFLKGDGLVAWPRHASNAPRALLNALTLLTPFPILDSHLLVYLAENYNSWHEASLILSRQLVAFTAVKSMGDRREEILAALRHCNRQLSERDIFLSLASSSCRMPLSVRAISFDVYNMINEAADAYMALLTLVESSDTRTLEPSDFEMDLWEDRWVNLQKELCQQEVVATFANTSTDPALLLECAWKAQEWTKGRSILTSAALLPATEYGDPVLKISETLLSVAEGKLSEVENLHAQTAQLCLYKWQLLPRLSSGSPSHSSLLHFFHRLVEIRESGQIMVETSNHSNGRTLPDLKNLLNAWRHRLPNDWEPLSTWDEIFSWRVHMFNAITSQFQLVCEPNTLATLHDRPWTAIRLAKTARKQGLRDVSLLLLNKAVEETAMNVSDAFFKLREQILTYYNLDYDLERHGGLNLVNTTNLSFFDATQKSELFRLKAMFLASLGGRSKANQAYCHSLQICPTYARAWESWGALCSSLGAVAEKQIDHAPAKSGDASKDPKAVAKKVAQYLAQAMGCYLEAIQLDSNEWNRIHLSKVLWMLMKDGPSHGVLCQTLENRGTQIPGWVWLPWLPQLLTGLCRPEGRAMKAILSGLAKSYPQAVYYSLRVFYLERRDVERTKGSPSSGHQMNSLLYVEELVSLLRRSHACLWSSLESVLEELLVKFRPLHEEELLSPMVALLERAESQLGTTVKKEEEELVCSSIWKTIWRIAAKFFRPSDQPPNRNDERSQKAANFKEAYRKDFEADFHVSSSAAPNSPGPEGKAPLTLEEFVALLRLWKRKLETRTQPQAVSLIDSSPALAIFGVADSPDLWPGACDSKYSQRSELDQSSEKCPSISQSSTSLSASAALNAALSAAKAVAAAAAREGVGADYGGGSSFIEIPGQYLPNTAQWADCRPSPELHSKLMRFEQSFHVLRRSDQIVRRIGMVGSDGNTYRFVVQAAVPFMTRTDERTAQIARILDMLLRKSTRSARSKLSVQPQSVTPMAQRLRLVSEPKGRQSLEDVYRGFCKDRGSDPHELATRFNDEVAEAMITLDTTDAEKGELQKHERAARLRVFNSMKEHARDDSSVLLRHMQKAMETPELLYHFRRVFSQQWAANCLLQHGFCVAERTPSRVVIVKSNGCALSPEFRISYNSQGYIESQLIPFRLTENLTNLIGFPLLDGHFVPSMANIADSVREHKQDLSTVLRLLARDDLIAFYTRSMPKSDSKTQEMEKQLADRVVKNAATILSRIGECAPRFNKDDTNSTDPIDKKVRDLIEAACNPENVCQMPSCYQGWL